MRQASWSFIIPLGPWPTGKYEVELYLDDAKEPTKALAFEVR